MGTPLLQGPPLEQNPKHNPCKPTYSEQNQPKKETFKHKKNYMDHARLDSYSISIRHNHSGNSNNMHQIQK